MDSARFGRVLGIGTRLAAKTVASAIDAAKAPSPTAGGTSGPLVKASPARAGATASNASQPAPSTPAERVRLQAREAVAQAGTTGRGLKEGGRRFGHAVWRPFARLSGVLWLEFTGVFFGLFAVTAALGASRLWNGSHAVSATHHPPGAFFVAVGMAALFGYFCVSSFVRAAHRGRQR
jgi:hypothetical protein